MRKFKKRGMKKRRQGKSSYGKKGKRRSKRIMKYANDRGGIRL